jgi:hypothetical protein
VKAPAPVDATPVSPSADPAIAGQALLGRERARILTAKLAVAPPTESRPLDLEHLRPIRLASCVFVEGTEGLVPGLWYEVTCEDGTLTVSGAPGSIPRASAISWPLTHIEVKTKGDRLTVTGRPGMDDDLRLVFQSTLDWTPMGLTQEVDARRRALLADADDT